jgi:hypothetical protein
LAVLGLELSTLSHSTSPIFVKGFRDRVLWNYLPTLASNLDLSDVRLLSWHEPQAPSFFLNDTY